MQKGLLSDLTIIIRKSESRLAARRRHSGQHACKQHKTGLLPGIKRAVRKGGRKVTG